MLQKTCSLLLDELSHHVAQNRANSIKPLVRGADVIEPAVIQQDLLDDEYGHRLTQFRAGLHDTEAEGDNFGREEEVDDFGGVIFHKGTDDSERGQPQVFERPRL